jgi:GLPGLI family protein
MRKLLSALIAVNLIAAVAVAQTGYQINYTRTMQIPRMRVQITGMSDEDAERMIPRTRQNEFILKTANNKMVIEQVEEVQRPTAGEGGGGFMRLGSIAGQVMLTYIDLATKERTEKTELNEKNYLVFDTINAVKFKLVNETKQILGKTCKKATATIKNPSRRIEMRSSGNGNVSGVDSATLARMRPKDSVTLEVWYCPGLAAGAGPLYQASLPGAILEINQNEGELKFEATSISELTDTKAVAAPTKGKQLSRLEYTEKQRKLIEEMRSRMGTGSGGPTIRFGN